MAEIANHEIKDDNPLEWHEGAAIGVVMASGGYPGSYEKGKPITGLGQLSKEITPFAAGVSGEFGSLKTSGGRVLCLTSRGKDLHEARDKLYSEIDEVKFDGAYRKDIGAKGLNS